MRYLAAGIGILCLFVLAGISIVRVLQSPETVVVYAVPPKVTPPMFPAPLPTNIVAGAFATDAFASVASDPACNRDPNQLGLPWPAEENGRWVGSAGCHGAYEAGDPTCAVDFTPVDNNQWFLCSSMSEPLPHTIVTSGGGLVVDPAMLLATDYGGTVLVDLNFGGFSADGNPKTGYAQLYVHVQEPQVRVGDLVVKGTAIGHPSCAGGTKGTIVAHLHFTTYLNGEPTVVAYSGYTAESGRANYTGGWTHPTLGFVPSTYGNKEAYETIRHDFSRFALHSDNCLNQGPQP